MTSIEPKYIPLTQQKYCCIPTCIQMILLRRGLKVYSQEEIGAKLGLVVPPEVKYLFSRIVKSGKKPKRGYGTREGDKGFHLNKFFISKNIPLKVKKIKISEAKKPKKLIEENLKKGNDILVVYNNKGIDKTSKNFGHGSLISGITKNNVILIDPSPERKKQYSVSLKKLAEAMTDKFDEYEREFWIIQKKGNL